MVIVMVWLELLQLCLHEQRRYYLLLAPSSVRASPLPKGIGYCYDNEKYVVREATSAL
jgi:hypothetical protein